MGKLVPGKNDLETSRPDLVEEWNFEKNELTPSEVAAGSNKKVWWKCKRCGGEWEAVISSRALNNRGCRYCSGQQALPGKTDLFTVCPELKEEWDFEKNTIDPITLTTGTNKKVWWKCKKCGESWEASVHNRAKKKKNTGCPFCSGRKATKGKNDLTTARPDLIKEWNYEKNDPLGLFPEDFTEHSNKKVWWKCQFGHEWKAQINSRSQGKGCRICNKEFHTSFPEQAVLFYIKQRYPEAENQNIEYGVELDIYIKSINVAIEYDGAFFHNEKREPYDIYKNEVCKENGIKLLRIREKGLSDLKGCKCIILEDDLDKSLENAIIEVLNSLSARESVNPVKVDIDADRQKIYEQYIHNQKENSLSKRYPKIAEEWCHERNKWIKPEQVSYSSNKKVWWTCDKGHDYEMAINKRTGRGDECPYCSSHKLLIGFNDLKTVRPDIAAEWDYERNDPKRPEDFMAYSNTKVWWVCKKNQKHRWEATINDRSSGYGCPFCSGRRAVKGENDLATLYPEIAKEWDYEKNAPLTPEECTTRTNKKVHWVCEHGHRWEAGIVERTNGNGCPYCSGKRAIPGENDLATCFPFLMKFWDYDKNEKDPEEYKPGSGKKVYWHCPNCDYKWKMSIYDMTRRKTICTNCKKYINEKYPEKSVE